MGRKLPLPLRGFDFAPPKGLVIRMRSILALWVFRILSSAVSWGTSVDSEPATQHVHRDSLFTKGSKPRQAAMTRVGLVAADPAVLPLGSRIRVTGAGGYSGEYIVADTGALVKGRHIDIFMPSIAAAEEVWKQRTRDGADRRTDRASGKRLRTKSGDFEQRPAGQRRWLVFLKHDAARLGEWQSGIDRLAI